jgi:hypothetical protein
MSASSFGKALFAGLQRIAQTCHLVHHRRRVFALRLELADLLRCGVATCLQVLGFRLDALAIFFQRLEAIDVKREAARGETLLYESKLAAQQLGV